MRTPTPKDEARRTQMRLWREPALSVMNRSVICQPMAVAIIRYKNESIVSI